MKTRVWRLGFFSVLFFCIEGMSWAQTATISYKTKCEVCHGATGLADTALAKRLNVLSFTDPTVVAKSDSALVGIIENGSGKMPAFTGKLTDQEISTLIQYIRQVQKH
jgi:mono/diheme cytochrome c family protein